MKITYLGQAGLLFDKDGFKVMIDPYFSDSVGRKNPKKHRRVPVDERFFEIQPDVMIFTHNHLDHYDPETASRFITPQSHVTVLAPLSVWERVQPTGGDNNYVLFSPHTQWTEGGIVFTAVKAAHSDPTPIGVILEADGKKYYVTGDTLYNTDIFADIPEDIDVLFLPVNGVGNNMNMTDAARFAKQVNPKKVVPYHVGLFDDLTADNFPMDNKVIPAYYEEIPL